MTGARPRLISSSISSFGLRASAREIASICCSPPDLRPALRSFSGLPTPSAFATYSTAHDLVDLGRSAMRNTTFATIVGTRSYHVAATSAHRAHTWRNLNPLLGMFSGAIGIKTGYTTAAGQCLLFEAKRGSVTLIGVVLGSSASISDITAASKDAITLLNWGFSR